MLTVTRDSKHAGGKRKPRGWRAKRKTQRKRARLARRRVWYRR